MKFKEFQKYNSNDQKKYGRILQVIYNTPGISRWELISALKYSKNYITKLINTMLNDGLIYEKNTVNSKVGRNPLGLYVKENLFYCLGAALSLEVARLVLVNAAGKVIDSRPLLHEGRMPERFLGELRQKIASLSGLIEPDRVLGIGTALPGIIDYKSGEICLSQAFPAESSLNLKAYFREYCGMRSLLINTAQIRAVMEKLHGGAAAMDNFLMIDHALGCGMYLNGKLYRGWKLLAGELGYTKITENDCYDAFGRNGLLVDQALFVNIGRQIKAAVRQGKKVKIEEQYLRDWDYIPTSQVVDAVIQGDKLVGNMVSEVFNYIGEAVVNLAFLLNPQAIFLPQWTAQCPAETIDIVKDKLKSYNMRSKLYHTDVYSSCCDPARMAETAAGMMINECFDQLLQET